MSNFNYKFFNKLNYEIIVYVKGEPEYHNIKNSFRYRVDAEIKDKFVFTVYKNKVPRGTLWFIWSSDRSKPDFPIAFSTITDYKAFAKENGIKLGTSHFVRVCKLALF